MPEVLVVREPRVVSIQLGEPDEIDDAIPRVEVLVEKTAVGPAAVGDDESRLSGARSCIDER